jgi:hypothetical protein
MVGGAPQKEYRIEESYTSALTPFTAQEIKNLAAGIPPNTKSFTNVSRHSEGGLASSLCASCTSGHRTTSSLRMEVSYERDFSVVSSVLPVNAEGMRIVRGRDGGIEQAASAMDGFFVTSGKDWIAIEQYHLFDCVVGENGKLKVAPGASFAGRCEVRLVRTEAAKKSKTFEMKKFYPLRTKEKCELIVVDLSQAKGRSQVVLHTYVGAEPVAAPEALLNHMTMQRIIWPEGPGYRQIHIASEKNMQTGELGITSHKVESWRVEKTGRRVLVSTEDLKEKEEQGKDTRELH